MFVSNSLSSLLVFLFLYIFSVLVLTRLSSNIIDGKIIRLNLVICSNTQILEHRLSIHGMCNGAHNMPYVTNAPIWLAYISCHIFFMILDSDFFSWVMLIQLFNNYVLVQNIALCPCRSFQAYTCTINFSDVFSLNYLFYSQNLNLSVWFRHPCLVSSS